jgi:aerobic carbon-monoxide dehydrogenase medium subunit
VIPATFAYDRATSVEEALELMRTHGDEAKIIAGGQSLLPLMKLRLARPERLIDIGRIASLRGVRTLPDGRLAIGSLTTYADLLDDASIMSMGAFSDALPRIADVQVRNRGTIGGSIAHADPASDLPAILLALDAEVVARSASRGERAIPIGGFFESAFVTNLDADELITEIRVPAMSPAHASAYARLEQPASGFAIAGVCAVLGRSGSGSSEAIDDVRIAVTGVGDSAYRATGAEDALRGGPAEGSALSAAAHKVTDGIDVQGDIHADRPYRSAMAVVMARRALEAASARLG